MNYREKMRRAIECPQFSNSRYGEWGALQLEQRKLIKSLLDELDNADRLINHLYSQNEDLKIRLRGCDKEEEEYISNLEKENAELKRQLQLRDDGFNAVNEELCEYAEKYAELKKQLEELMKTNNVLTQELTKDSDIKQDYLTTCCGIPIGDIPSLKYENDRYKRLGFKHLNDENNKLINQQKEFVNYLEKERERCLTFYNYTECTYAYDVFKNVLSKYKEIIGGENE